MGFGEWMRREGYSPRTIKLYSGRVKLVETWLHEQGFPVLRRCRWEQIAGYGQSLAWTHASREGVKSTLATYWRFLGRDDCPATSIRSPSKPRMKSKALPDNAIGKLLTCAAEIGKEPYAAACLCYYPALRIEEAASLRWTGIDGAQVTVIGKGSKTETLPLHARCVEALDALPQWNEFVFPGRILGSHRHQNTLRDWIHDAALMAGLGAKVTPHVLRHTAISSLVDTTGDLFAVQQFARHSSPDMTAKYSKLRESKLRAIVDLL